MAGIVTGAELPRTRPALSATTGVMSDSNAASAFKSPRGAILRSLLIPGWGQWYNEKKFKAVLVFGTEVGISINSIIQNQYLQRSTFELEREYYLNNRNLSNWALLLAVLVSMLDAYVDAHLFHFDESPDLGYNSTITTLINERGNTLSLISFKVALSP